MSKRPENWKRQYPWTPDKSDKTVQSFAAMRSGLLPVIEIQEGKCRYTILDIFTKAGARSYDAESRRAIQPEPTKPTKKGK